MIATKKRRRSRLHPLTKWACTCRLVTYCCRHLRSFAAGVGVRSSGATLPLPSLTAGVDYPADNPAAPLGWAPFNPPGSVGTPGSTAPAISAITPIAGQNDTLAIAGWQLTSDTVFKTYGQTNSGNGTLVNAILPSSSWLDTAKNVANIVIDPSQVSKGMYLVWPSNSNGVGLPIAVNKTESIQVFFTPSAASQAKSRVVVGETCTCTGRNLTSTDRSTTSLTVATGTQTLTVPAGRTYAAGQTVVLNNYSFTAPSPANVTTTGLLVASMIGTVTSATTVGGTTTLVLNITTANGSGTYAFWDVCSCWIYWIKSDGSQGAWLTPVELNECHVNFVVPTADTSATYYVWLHNGFGDKRGWAQPLSVVIATADNWTAGGTVYMGDYGASGQPNSGLDCTPALTSALTDLSGGAGKIVFGTRGGASGTYLFKASAGAAYNIQVGGGYAVWLTGISGQNTVLASYAGESFSDGLIRNDYGLVTDLTVDTTAATLTAGGAVGGALVSASSTKNVTLICKNGPENGGSLRPFSYNGTLTNIYHKNLTIHGQGFIGGSGNATLNSGQFYVDGFTYYGTSDGSGTVPSEAAFFFTADTCGVYVNNAVFRHEASLTTNTSSTSLTIAETDGANFQSWNTGASTSTSNLTIGSPNAGPNYSFAVSGLPTSNVVGLPVILLNGGNYIYGTIVSYNGTTLVLSPILTGGSGTFASWTVTIRAVTITTQTNLPISVGDPIMLYGTSDAAPNRNKVTLVGQAAVYNSSTGVLAMAPMDTGVAFTLFKAIGCGTCSSWTFNSTKKADYCQGRIMWAQNCEISDMTFNACQTIFYSTPMWFEAGGTSGDPNKGESFNWENNGMEYVTNVAAATSNTITFYDANYVTISAGATGTFTLTFTQGTTSAIAAGASASTVQTVVQAVLGANNAVVRLYTNPNSGVQTYTIEFAGTLTGSQTSPTIGTGSLTGTGSVTHAAWIHPYQVIITNGKGFAQARYVTGGSGLQLTVDRPWTLTPDPASSRASVGEIAYRVTVHKCALEGNNYFQFQDQYIFYLVPAAANTGFAAFVGGSDIVLRDNDYSGFMRAISVNTGGSTLASPAYMWTVNGCRFNGCCVGVDYAENVSTSGNENGSMFGITFNECLCPTNYNIIPVTLAPAALRVNNYNSTILASSYGNGTFGTSGQNYGAPYGLYSSGSPSGTINFYNTLVYGDDGVNAGSVSTANPTSVTVNEGGTSAFDNFLH